MARLIYLNLMSLDGFIAGDDQEYDWSVPSADMLRHICDLLRPVGTYLYGRKTYETMAVWQTPEVIPGLGPDDEAFARIWQAADKRVYSRTLESVSTPRTSIERSFDPEAIRAMKSRLPHDLTVAGPTLAIQAIEAGLVDEYQLLLLPVLRGGGRRVLPDHLRLALELVDERRFDDGMVALRYRPRS